ALSTAHPRHRGELRSTPGAAEPIAQAGLWHGRAVRDGFVWHRVSGAVAAGTVALPEFRHIGDDRRLDPVLEQPLLGNFLSRSGADRRAGRAHQYDGVHPPAVERIADLDRVRPRSIDCTR